MRDVIATFVFCFLFAGLSTAAENTVVPADAPYRNPKLPVSERVQDLLQRMTLDEKIAQMAQFPTSNMPDTAAECAKYYGKVSPGILAVNFSADVLNNAKAISVSQKYLREKTRLGIPAIICTEALHGVMIRPCTIYPQAIALGSTWNTELVRKAAGQIATEASALGVTQVLSPVLDLARDPRYGRVEECYGECPTLVARMGVAFITGLQGEDARNGLAPDKVYAMPKHFAGYSVPANGINIAPVLIGERELLTHHLVPFEAAVKEAHAMAIMPSYNSVDGVPSHANFWLLTDVLRKEWGFEGYIYSDWSGIDFLVGHRVAGTLGEAGLIAAKAGVDVDAPRLSGFKSLPAYVRQKQLDESVINAAVARILRAKFLAGLFDGKRDPLSLEQMKAVVRTVEHIETSRKVAEESVILLKNEKNLLPLDADKVKSVAVIGPNAAQVQFGDYSWSKSNKHGLNFLNALSMQLGGKMKINYAKGCDLVGLSTNGFAGAVKAAKESDVAVVVIGDTSMIFSGVGWDDPSVPSNGTVGEGFDVNNPVPPGVQEDLVKAVVAAGKPTIVVLLNGRPYCLPWMHQNVPALIEAFYPGEQQGNALVDVIFGRVNPSGRLPVTLARSAGHIPCTYDFKPYGRGYYHKPGTPGTAGRDYVFDSPAPLWPFGFGLSYTTFVYSNLKIEVEKISGKNGILKYSYEVKNTGSKTGKVVAQTYWRDFQGEIAPPEKRLLRFDKIELKPGESQLITHAVPAGEFRSLSVDKKWIMPVRGVELQVGDNAEAGDLLKRTFILAE